MPGKAKRAFTLQWIADILLDDAGTLQRSMFGCQAIYRRGRFVIGLADKQDPWCGVLVPTEREHHASLQAEYPMLTSHPVLGKWLYLSRSHESFEEIAVRLTEAIQRGDLRIGIEPKPKARKRAQAGGRSQSSTGGASRPAGTR